MAPKANKYRSLEDLIGGVIFSYRAQIHVNQHRLWREIRRPYFSNTSLEKPQKPQDTEAAKADIKFTDLILMLLINKTDETLNYGKEIFCNGTLLAHQVSPCVCDFC